MWSDNIDPIPTNKKTGIVALRIWETFPPCLYHPAIPRLILAVQILLRGDVTRYVRVSSLCLPDVGCLAGVEVCLDNLDRQICQLVLG